MKVAAASPRSIINVVTSSAATGNLMFLLSSTPRLQRQPNNPWENKASRESINITRSMKTFKFLPVRF